MRLRPGREDGAWRPGLQELYPGQHKGFHGWCGDFWERVRKETHRPRFGSIRVLATLRVCRLSGQQGAVRGVGAQAQPCAAPHWEDFQRGLPLGL